MNKNLVTSLELSKRLEKLGVKQESEFYWAKAKVMRSKGESWILTQIKNAEFISAFLSGELGEMLPKGEYLEIFFHSLEIQLKTTIQRCPDVFQGKTLAEAMGKMVQYLKENKLI